MPTLRDQLKARRTRYLERCAIFDMLACDEPSDLRAASVRGFLEGGDDVPPECEARGVVRERRRLPAWIPQADIDAAKGRLGDPGKNEASNEADWDRFATLNKGVSRTFVSGVWREVYNPFYNLYRLTTQLVRATEYFKANVPLKVHEVLEVRAASLPQLTETDESVPKAWFLLRMCGCDDNKLSGCYQDVLDKAESVKTEDQVDVTASLSVAVATWLGSFEGSVPVTDGQACQQQQPLPPRAFDPTYPCQRKEPIPLSAQFAPLPTLDQVRPDAEDAVLAMLNDGTVQTLIDEFRFIKTDSNLIAQIFKYFKGIWDGIPAEYQYAAAGYPWYVQHPGAVETKQAKLAWMESPSTDDPDEQRRKDETKINWSKYKEYGEQQRKVLASLRAVPQFFIKLSQKTVGEVCAEIFRGLWPDDDHKPYDDKELDSSDLNRDDYLAAIDRATAPGRVDCPFRLAALLGAAEGYMRVLDKLTPTADGDLADRFTPPEINPLNALYWRVAILPSTIGHILTMADTADFKIAEHLRFLGLFRPGGRYRTGKPEDADYENYISQFIPPWVIDFMTAALVRVKYWLDDRPLGRPSGKEMTYWSENHQILFGSAEYILSAWFSSATFAYTNKPASWHHDRALSRVRAWLDHRLELGFSELNSGTYYNQHLPALFNLVDFAPDDEIRTKSLMVLDLMMFDIVRRVCQGSFVAASGRQYWGGKRSGWSISIVSMIEVLTGLIGDQWSANENSACSFVTSRYVDDIPECLLAIAHDTASPRVDRSRTSINLSESKDYKIDPDSSSGIVFWWGCGGYFTEDTYSATQSWSNRWSLHHSGPFAFFKWVDNAITRLVSAILYFFFSAVPLAISGLRQGLLSNLLSSVINYFASILSELAPAAEGAPMMDVAAFPIGLMNAVMLTPQLLRRLLDVVLSALDVIVGAAAGLMKTVGLLDDDDDRVRVARPALEQEFRALAIEFNAGSVLQRQHFYGWRGRDAMLSSFTDNAKGATAFQTEPCVATLGMNVTVFTGKRPKTSKERTPGSQIGVAAEGYARGAARYAYDPSTIVTSQLEVVGGEPAPEIGGLAAPLAAGSIFSDDGPMYWFGNLSSPLVYQNENVAISIFKPTDLQENLCPEETHAHWPFDHFDEIITDERNGGRWMFGRRDRRFPPRTPCEPVTWKPSDANPLAFGKRRDERGEGSGYVALFSARGMETRFGEDYKNYTHRELVANGHSNIWVTVVGDRATYKSFASFRDDVLAATLDLDLDKMRCSITMPLPGSKQSGNQGKKFEVSWEDGATLDGAKITTDGWPRFEWNKSSLEATAPSISSYDLRVDDVRVFSPGKDRVDWGDKTWRIEATVRAWQEAVDKDGNKKQVETQQTLYVEHDFTTPDKPKRELSDEGIQALRGHTIRLQSATADLALAILPQANAQSTLGQSFRKDRKELFKLRR